LIHALYDTAKVAVVRFVKKMNDRPLLGILIPVVKADVEAFYFNQLPFEEDIRESVEREMGQDKGEDEERRTHAAPDREDAPSRSSAHLLLLLFVLIRLFLLSSVTVSPVWTT
jgi:hypothetical protein